MKTDKMTIIRTVALAITWLNVILVQNAMQPIPVLGDEEISLILAGAASIFAWFYNNYITVKGKMQKAALERNNLK